MDLKKTGCDVWQLECQASSVIASVHVKFSRNLIYQKLKKRLIFDRVIQKNKKVDDVGTSVDEPFCRTTWRINIVVCQSMLARIRAFY